MRITKKSAVMYSLALSLAACGGGGGGGKNNDDQLAPSEPPNNQPSNGNNNPSTAGTFLPCLNTDTLTCSGGTILETNNMIAMTESSVQVYGKSTSDSIIPRTPELRGTAWGLAPDSGGIAEIRLEKDTDGNIKQRALMLSNIGISWDNTNNRPPIIDIFSDKQGRVTLTGDANRSLKFGPLPPSYDLSFYDWAVKRTAGTQGNYANNYYFPRSEPIRCEDAMGGDCSTDYSVYAARQVPRSSKGNWRTSSPSGDIQHSADEYSISRLHEDGDLRAGDDLPGPNGERRFHDKGNSNSGFGVSYPGFKGYREFQNYSYQYANLANWMTQDTVDIVEWAGGADEHNKDRRGYVAFGKVTPTADMPTSGTATYRGVVYGTYAQYAVPTTEAQDVDTFMGEANITVNFASRTVTVQVVSGTTPANLNTTVALGASGTNKANYFTGRANDTASQAFAQSGLSGRFFGPVVNGAPAELGGTFILSGNGAGETVMAGFIARRQ